MTPSTKARAARSGTPTINEPPRQDCAFCKVAIRHLHHVPADRVRVGQDYGDAE